MKVHDPQSSIRTAARELIERYGGEAVSIARHRASSLGASGASPEHDTALLVLSAVEDLSMEPSGEDS